MGDGVDIFIQKARFLLKDGRFDFVPRRKNMLSLAKYGFTIADAKDEIASITRADYYKGPKRDLNPACGGDIWEFKRDIQEIRFYIKLKISDDDGREMLKCLGFHEDDF